jgi:hypothetical protein
MSGLGMALQNTQLGTALRLLCVFQPLGQCLQLCTPNIALHMRLR